MPAANKPSKRASKDQVRAWLTTVIAPMADALAVEQDRLLRESWSFRCSTQDFEFLWPVHKMVAVSYAPNLEQLLRYHSDIGKRVQAHDRALANLRSAARNAYQRLRHSDRFLARTAGLREEDVPYLAEYAVNGIRELDSFYVHHDMWKRDGAEFLGLRDTPPLAEHFEQLKKAGREFAKAVDGLRKLVLELQVELADKYKLPPVEPVDSIRA